MPTWGAQNIWEWMLWFEFQRNAPRAMKQSHGARTWWACVQKCSPVLRLTDKPTSSNCWVQFYMMSPNKQVQTSNTTMAPEHPIGIDASTFDSFMHLV